MPNNKPHTEESKKKISIALKKKWQESEYRAKLLPSRRNYKPTKETNEKISKSRMGIEPWNKGKKWKNPTYKKRWEDVEFRKKMINAISKGNLHRPTSLEKDMIALIAKHDLPYKYVGDGELIVGGKNPDFVNTNGEKILIEVGNVFHHQNGYEEKRKAHFNKSGWKCFVFIGNKLDEDKIIETLDGGE